MNKEDQQILEKDWKEFLIFTGEEECSLLKNKELKEPISYEEEILLQLLYDGIKKEIDKEIIKIINESIRG